MGFKVLYTFPTRQQGMDMVREVATIKTLRDQYPTLNPITENELLTEMVDVDALVNVRHVLINRRIIEAAKHLKIIARHGLGYETVDLEAATNRDILVTRTAGQGLHAVAEYTIGVLLALSKRLIPANASVKSGNWETYNFFGIQVRNKTLGIIGLGGIGSEVARVAKVAFQMEVIAYDPYVSQERAKEVGIKLVDLDSLLRQSDYISIHASVEKETKRILSREQFDLMKEGVFIINCARGVLLDEKALYTALLSGKVAGAALDVFAKEPPRDSPILQLENVILTPHIAGMTEESAEGMANSVAESVIAVLRDRLPKLENVVNKSVLERRFSLGKITEPEDVANIAAFLANKGPGVTIGQVINVSLWPLELY